MKYTIEIDLCEGGDSREELNIQMNATQYYMALTEFAEQLRRHVKYDEKQDTDWETVREEFYRTLEDNDVNLH